MLFTGSKAKIAALERLVAHQQRQIHQLAEQLRERTPAALAVRVDELSAAFDALRSSNRREFGRLWKRVGAPGRNGALVDTDTGEVLAEGDELDALLKLQQSAPVQPK